MSPPLDQLLLHWINWYIPDGGDLKSIEEARESPKLQKTYEKLLPPQLQPQSDDSLEYIYTVIACYIKSFNHGPDKFTPPQFSQTDELRNMKTILMHLFLLFKIVDTDVQFSGDQPEWFVQLSEKYDKWNQIQSTTNEFPMPILIATTNSEIEQSNAKIKKLQEDFEKLDNDIQTKIQNTKVAYDAVLASQTDDLKAAQIEKQKLLDEQEQLEKAQKKFRRKSEFSSELIDSLTQLNEEQENLKEELEKLKNEEKEIAQIKVELTGMEKIQLNEQLQEDAKKKEELEKQKQQLIEKLSGDIDFTERDQLAAAVSELTKKAEATNPDEIISQWHKLLDEEISKTEMTIEKFQSLISMGNDFFGQ